MAGTPRVLVLGSERHGREVVALPWQALPEGLNVADFDVVILNFTAFGNPVVREHVDLSRLPSTEQFARLIFSAGATIVAVGDPTVAFGEHQTDVLGHTRFASQRATWWLPIELPVKKIGGESIRDVLVDWEFWFRSVDCYTWHFWNSPEPTREAWTIAAARAALPWAEGFLGHWEALAQTRYGDPIAVSLEVVGFAAQNRSQPRTETAAASIFWLPSPTKGSLHDAITSLLREAGGLPVLQPRPAWVARFALPREVSAAQTVSDRRRDLERATEAVASAEEALAKEEEYSQLLYEQGQDTLEPIVRRALQDLGAAVTEPARAGIEDGRLTDPEGRIAMLEIKGRRGQVRLEDVRQLDGWMRTAIAEEGWDGKGIIIANTLIEEPPDQRRDVVAPNALQFAKRVDIAIVTTTQVHAAIRQLQDGSFQSTLWWRTLFSAAGLVEAP